MGGGLAGLEGENPLEGRDGRAAVASFHERVGEVETGLDVIGFFAQEAPVGVDGKRPAAAVLVSETEQKSSVDRRRQHRPSAKQSRLADILVARITLAAKDHAKVVQLADALAAELLGRE